MKNNDPGDHGAPDVPAPVAAVPWWRSWFSRYGLPGLILLLAVVLTYQPLWHAGYIWDDDVLITENPCIIGPLGLKEVWTTKQADLCPLAITTFWVEHKLWGLSPVPYHVMNVLLHAVCAMLLWRVLLRLGAPGAWLGAMLWALHPVQVESVGWISETKNTQSGIFFLLAILAFLRSLKAGEPAAGPPWRTRPDGWTVVYAALAMVSKTSTVVLPVILCLLAWWVDGRWNWRRAWAVGPVFLLSLAASVLTIWTQVPQPGKIAGSHLVRSWAERLVIAGKVIWFYLGKLAWPHPLMTVYPHWDINARTWSAYLPLLAAAVVLLVLWLKRRTWGSVWLLTYAYFLVALLPVMGFAEISGFRYSFVSDHFTYLANMGPLALAGSGVVWLGGHLLPAEVKWRQAGVSACAGLLLVLGAVSWHRARDYESQETLWTDALAKNPQCWVGDDNLGVALAQKGQLDAAVSHYHRALQLGPNDAQTHDNLGTVLLRKEQADDAIAEYREALKADPGYAAAYYNLGNVFLQRGQVDDAIAHFRSAIKISDDYIVAHSNLGAALKRKGQVDDAIVQYQKALQLDPANVQNLNNLGNLYLKKGQVDKATATYVDALKINPNDAYTYRNLGNILSQKGHLDDAIAEYLEALKINPTDAESHNNLGSVFLQKGQVNEAAAQYQEAVKIDAGYASAHRNLGLALARRGQLNEAITQLKIAIHLQPDDGEAQHDLATVETLAAQASGAPK